MNDFGGIDVVGNDHAKGVLASAESDHHEEEHCCFPSSGQQKATLLYVPHLCIEHKPLSTVPYAEVKALLDEGLITLCDGAQIYHYEGHGIATICSDPSVRKPKVDILNARGELAIMSDPGIGLQLSPASPVYDESCVQRIRKFLTRTNGHFNLNKLFVIAAHFPCGYAQYEDGTKLSLREKILLVADGACHMKSQGIFGKVIATVFITTKMPYGSIELGWYHIRKSVGQNGCQLL